MRIGVVSDIHGNAGALLRAFALMGDVDVTVSLGDNINQFDFSNEVIDLLRRRDVRTIKGNHEEIFYSPLGARARQARSIDVTLMQWLEAQPGRVELSLGNRRIVLTHSTDWLPSGEYVNPHSPSFLRFGESGADILMYGHTHQPVAKQVGKTLVINPGSVGEGRPTGSGFVSSCAVVDSETLQVEFIDFTV